MVGRVDECHDIGRQVLALGQVYGYDLGPDARCIVIVEVVRYVAVGDGSGLGDEVASQVVEAEYDVIDLALLRGAVLVGARARGARNGHAQIACLVLVGDLGLGVYRFVGRAGGCEQQRGGHSEQVFGLFS